MPPSLQLEGESFFALHPQIPKLMFTANSSIFLADIERKLDLVKLLGLHPTSDQPNSKIKEIGFSACGSYFLVTYADMQWPHIHPLHIPEWPTNSEHTKGHPASKTPSKDIVNTRKRKMCLGANDVDTCSTLQIAKMPKAIHTGEMAIYNKGNTNTCIHGLESVRVSHNVAPQNGQSIDLVTQSQDSSVRTFSLIQFPTNIDIANTQSTVLWPEDQHAPIQIIVNASTKTSYVSNQNHSSPFLPVILSRNLHSLPPPSSIHNRLTMSTQYPASTAAQSREIEEYETQHNSEQTNDGTISEFPTTFIQSTNSD